MTCSNCATLREEVARMRRAIGVTVDPALVNAIAKKLEIRPAAAAVCAVLYGTSKVVSHATLRNAAGVGDTAVKVHVRSIRRALGGEPIHTFMSHGYQMTAEGKRLLKEAIGGGVPMEAMNDDAETPLPIAIAMLLGRHAHSEGPDASYLLMDNIRAALEKQYG